MSALKEMLLFLFWVDHTWSVATFWKSDNESPQVRYGELKYERDQEPKSLFGQRRTRAKFLAILRQDIMQEMRSFWRLNPVVLMLVLRDLCDHRCASKNPR